MGVETRRLIKERDRDEQLNKEADEVEEQKQEKRVSLLATSVIKVGADLMMMGECSLDRRECLT